MYPYVHYNLQPLIPTLSFPLDLVFPFPGNLSFCKVNPERLLSPLRLGEEKKKNKKYEKERNHRTKI